MFLRNVVIFGVVTLALSTAVWLSPRPAEASTDLTGSWTFDWMGAPAPYPIPCTSAAVKQHGTDLYIYFTCPPGRVFSGTYDKGTGYFTVTTTVLCKGFVETPLTLSGTVSLDGNSMGGVWSTYCIYPIDGTFSADRSGPATVTFTPPPTSTPTATDTSTPTATATTCVCPTPTPPPVAGVAIDAQSDGTSALDAPWLIAVACASFVGLGGVVLFARRW